VSQNIYAEIGYHLEKHPSADMVVK